tara:strand:- start:212 stop:448 length:237 start_codon:yes stop_codon:yes gene_type:complete
MQQEIKEVVNNFLSKNKLDKIQQTEKEIVKELGTAFLQKHIKQIFIQGNNIIIKTKTIEAKTEINLIKTKLNNHIKIK